MATQIEPQVAEELFRRYKIVAPGGRPLHGGVVAALGGHKRADGRKLLTLTIENVAESRICPFENGEGSEIVRRFSDQHLIPRHPALEKMLEHLVCRAAKMYSGDVLDSFVFDDVHLHESGYFIGSAQLFGNKDLKLRRRPETAPDEGARRYDARSKPIGKKSRRT
jgi:hypothetical protein